MTVRDALNKGMDEEMERDARVFIIGSSSFSKAQKPYQQAEIYIEYIGMMNSFLHLLRR